MSNVVLKIAAGAVIPALATIIFNLLTLIIHSGGQKVVLEPSLFDIAIGSAFSLIGICVAMKDSNKIVKFLILFVMLLLIVIVGEILAPAMAIVSGWNGVFIVDGISIVCLCWAITEAEAA